MDVSPVMPAPPQWRNTRGRRALTAISYPVVWLLNRPGMRWFGHMAYDFALRCNGVAINYPGHHGLTIGEERFAAALLADKIPGVFFDVGANGGSYARYLNRLSPASRVYAFEPHPRTFAALQRDAGGLPNVSLFNLAVSDQAGDLMLHDFAAQDGSTQASLDRDAVLMFSAETVAHAVRVTTLDDFMSEHEIAHIDLLKIDTEGFDLAVLRGARRALSTRAIKAIQFEFIPANIARHVTMRDFFEVLQGYRIYRLCINGALWPIEPYDVKRCEIYVTHNLVALAP